MFTRLKLSVRPATQADRQDLANLIHFEIYVHRHLDWRPPLDWLGHQPYLLAEQDGNIVAALACPPDPPDVGWIRLFAVSSLVSVEKVWQVLWPEARELLAELPVDVCAAAIPMHNWFETLLKDSHFEETHRVIMLNWEANQSLPEPEYSNLTMRPMNFDDLVAVEKVDVSAFGKVWKNSQDGLELAFRQAAVASVVEAEGELVGYQISTATPIGGHLARLAVKPNFQRRGIGFALICDTLSQFQRRGAKSVSVNTQHDNRVSLSLYQKAGFHRTGEEHPVYQFDPKSPKY
jgi:ribosomal protein S18 acetylase RimI-like enzyme